MRIAIFGAGAVGGYFGGRLAQAGEDVVFISRGDFLKGLQNNGLRVDSINGDFVLKPVRATDDPHQVGNVDLVLIGVKAWQVPEAAEAIRPLLGSETFILPLQNGIETPSKLAGILGEQHVIAGLCGLFCYIEGPGHIVHAGTDPFVKFGELDNHKSRRVEELRNTFVQAGIKVETPSDIQTAIWMKFLLITVWSGIGAITRTPVGVWRSLPETRSMVKVGLNEIISVAQAMNISLPKDALDNTMAFYDGLSPESTSSLQRDIIKGRPSELEAQIGAVVRFGKVANVAVPQHTFLYNSLFPLELQARCQGGAENVLNSAG